MGTDRTWEIERDRFSHMCHPPLEMGECVSVVEESRLREAEAERDRALSFHEAVALQRLQGAEARAERLEAELREAREALEKCAYKLEGLDSYKLAADVLDEAHDVLRRLERVRD